jgi:hypothetical protein
MAQQLREACLTLRRAQQGHLVAAPAQAPIDG